VSWLHQSESRSGFRQVSSIHFGGVRLLHRDDRMTPRTGPWCAIRGTLKASPVACVELTSNININIIPAQEEILVGARQLPEATTRWIQAHSLGWLVLKQVRAVRRLPCSVSPRD
jgi:hypothetical protein